MSKKIIIVSLIKLLLLCDVCFAMKLKDVEAIKSTVIKKVAVDKTGKQVPYTRITQPSISGNYALTTILFIEGAAQILLIKKNNKWNILAGDGGAFGKQGLLEYGVPAKDAESIMKQEQEIFKKK